MITYVLENRNPAKDIIEKAKSMFNLETIASEEMTWLGNRDMMLGIGKEQTDITLYNDRTNVKKLKEYIMGK